ncbi:EAL domain-containing response regulator [Pseudomonas protegens]|uniref:EAL domain-containing response regulator n=1 Tax=Pseudomonas protegens TaxID=380021 RepID=UPI0021C88B1E|nr:EAL domain-containing response regulator [Pseudomonas protegens]MCU1765527.1 EAL domain-containing response regulator [Pseudomonas protegens]
MTHLKILVLEELSFERAVIIKILYHIGYDNIIQARSASEALSILQIGGAVDLTICSLQLNEVNDVDSLTFLRLAGEKNLIRSVIICSKIAPDLKHFLEQAISSMGIELLGDVEKPININVLDRLMRQKSQEASTQREVTTSLKATPSRNQLLRAFTKHEIQAYYQPKIDLLTGDVIGAEVLVRWETEGRIIQPSQFISAIESHGLWDTIFYSILEQGLKTLDLLRNSGYNLSLAFNLHCSQLANLTLTKKISSALRHYNIPGQNLTFEITESELMNDSSLPLENLIRLRIMGCGLSIDDFGVGFSSLERLCQLPFSEIKIDASFVQNMITRPNYKAAVEYTLALAASMNMKVVAEGIETIEQRDALLKMGCTAGQGYLYAPPMNWQEMLSWAIVGGRHRDIIVVK